MVISKFVKQWIASKNNFFLKCVLLFFVLQYSPFLNAQISLRAYSTSSTLSTTNVTIVKPTGTVAGDVMIVNIATNGNNMDPSLSGWSLVGSQSSLGGSNNRHAVILYKVATNSEASSYTFSLGSGASGVAAGMMSFSGVDTSGGSPFDYTGSFATGNDKIPTANSISTSIANAAVIMFTQIAGGTGAFSSWTATSPSTLTEIYDVAGTNTQVAAAWSLKSSLGNTGSGINSITNNKTWGAILLALKPCLPTVTSQPNSLVTVCEGGSFTLSAVISGATSYQWKKNGNTITGATASSLTLNNLSLADSGKYTLIGTSNCGSTIVTDSSVVKIISLPTVSITSDYCAVAGKVRLKAVPSPTGTYTYSWSNGTTKDTTSVDLAGSYSVTVTNSSGCQASTILPVSIEYAVNGNFEQGNTGFTTPFLGTQHYLYVVDTPNYQRELYPEGYYAVDTNANNLHNNFWGHDHTSGNGKFMIVNGFPGVQPIVWQETINVTPNTTYYFSAWAMSLNSSGNYASLKFSINGAQVGTTAVLSSHGTTSSAADNWTRFYATWNSGSATTATCSIVDLQTATGGNDFGIDDISISTLAPFVSLSSDSSTTQQSVCQNSPISTINFVIGSGGSPIVTGLPNGVSYTYNGYNLVISGRPTSTGTYNFSVSTSGCSIFSITGKIIVNPVTWTGSVNSDWDNISNWCGSVPTFSTNVIIPSGVVNAPLISNNANTNTITINAGASLSIGLNGTLSLKGDFINNGSVQNNGEIELVGNATQSFPGSGSFTSFDQLVINKSAGSVVLNNSISIYKLLGLTNGTLDLNNYDITLKSNANATASIGNIPSTASILYGTGRFVVERYIPTGTNVGQHGKSWQFLSVPTNGTQTVKQAWQENAAFPNHNSNNGYGIQITSNLSNALSLGFDVKTTTPSMKTYDASIHNFVGIPNTNTYPIKNSLGYMVFIRGNRNDTSYLQPAEPTTLRSRGTIFLRGAEAPPVSTIASGKYQSIGNPYASAIDFSNTTGVQFDRTAIDNAFYVWDPTLAGSYNYGGYQTISSANNWRPVPGNTINYASGISNPKIQSGQAFFMHATGAGGTVTFTEDAKVNGSKMAMRGSSNDSSINAKQFFDVKLLALVNGESKIADGVALVISHEFANNNASNAPKLLNNGENLSINKEGSLLSIQANGELHVNDTVFLNTSNLRLSNYQLVFIPENFSDSNLVPYLVDKNLNTSTELSLTDTSIINFSNTSNNTNDRFFIVFKPGFILPISNFHLDGQREKNNTILLQWESLEDAVSYQLERSYDGKKFESIHELPNFKKTFDYNDTTENNGIIYYRVKAFYSNGSYLYSNIKTITGTQFKLEMSVYPNPVIDQLVKVSFSNIVNDKLSVKIIAQNGKVIYNSYHKVLNGHFSFKISSNIPKGEYLITVTNSLGVSLSQVIIL